MRQPRVVLAVLIVSVVPLAGCVTGSGWALEMTGIVAVQNNGRTGDGVRVAIVDTGIDASHPQFKGVSIAWLDLINGRGDAYDDNGHGTHVAGILIAQGGLLNELTSGVKVQGAAPGIAILAVKAIRANGEGSDDTVAKAVDEAVSGGAHIVLMSLGGAKGFLVVGTRTESAVNRAIDAGVFVIAAAGNDGQSASDVASPASVERVIAVGAVDRSKSIASFSQRGDNEGTLPILNGRDNPFKKPEVVAPGVAIVSTWRDGQYATAEGTSQAAPFVAAALALILEAKPTLKRGSGQSGNANAVVKDALMRSSEKIGPLAGQGETAHDDAYGYGLLRADAWLSRLG